MKLRLEADVRVRVERALQEREQLVALHLAGVSARLQRRAERVELVGEAVKVRRVEVAERQTVKSTPWAFLASRGSLSRALEASRRSGSHAM